MHLARAALIAAFVAGCREQPSERALAIEPVARAVPSPAPDDVGNLCGDVFELRACWGEHSGAVHGVLAVARPTPSARIARGGWRCSGSGKARVCEDRALESDAFDCQADACSQRRPRMPDDGEWECADSEGVVICHGGGAAAGTVPGPADPSWICGPRRNKPAERVCVDFAPDRPERAELRDCRFQYEPGKPLRVCRRGREPGVGRACSSSACPAGSVCAGGHCLPLAPKPECWLDADCGRGVCVFGSCRGEGA